MTDAEKTLTFFEAYDRHDFDAMLDLCAPDATFEYVPYGEEGKGQMQDAVPMWQGFVDPFPDFSVQVKQLRETKEGAVVAENLLGGTQEKEIMGIENKGPAQYTPHLFIVEFDDAGRISHLKAYWDNGTVYRQLGHTQQHD